MSMTQKMSMIFENFRKKKEVSCLTAPSVRKGKSANSTEEEK